MIPQEYAVGRRRRIVILQGHPDPKGRHFGHALAASYVAGAEEAGHQVQVIEIATLEFPWLQSREDLEHGVVPTSIQQAQATILGADHVVLIYPVWNGSVPALVRGFFEQVFRPSFMFPDMKPGEHLGFRAALAQRKALTGKSARIVVTMQMPAFVYRWYFRPHPEKNTLRLAGLRPIRETYIGLVESPKPVRREQGLRTVRALGHAGR